MSLTRGSTGVSPVTSARRSAFETTSSSVEIGSRWLTPLRLSTFLSSRAVNATCSTTSRRYCGISIGAVSALRPRLLRGNRDALFQRLRIMRANLRADAVLQRRDDLAARRVVLRIGAEHQRHIQRQAHRIALDLNVAFLHDVEQRHLDLAGQVGQLVDGEDVRDWRAAASRSAWSARWKGPRRRAPP